MSNPFTDLINQSNALGAPEKSDPFKDLIAQSNSFVPAKVEVPKPEQAPTKKLGPLAQAFKDGFGAIGMRDLENLGSSAIRGFGNAAANIGTRIAKGLDPAGELGAIADPMRRATPSQILDSRAHVNERIDEFASKIAPIDGPEGPSFKDKAERVVGTIVGQMPFYITGSAATKSVLSFAPSALRTRAAKAVVDVTKGIVDPKVRGAAQAMIGALPQEVLSGVGTQAVVDPASVSTPQGLAMAAGMSTVGTIFNGIQGWQAANPNPALGGMLAKSPGHNFPQPGQTVTPDQARGLYGQMIGTLKERPKNWWDKLGDLAHDIDRKYFSGKSVLKYVGDQNSGGGGVSLEDRANLLSGSSAIAHETIYDTPMVINSATGRWEKAPIPGLKQIFETIPPEQRAEFKGYLLARHRLDPGVEQKVAEGWSHPDDTGDLARLAVLSAPKHFEDAARMFDQVNRVNLDNSFKAGLLTKDNYQWLKDNYPSYVSNSHSLQSADNPLPFAKRTSGSSNSSFVDPIDAYAASTEQTVNKARINQFYNNLYDYHLKNPDETRGIFEINPIKPKATAQEVADYIEAAKKDGVTLTQVAAEALANMKKVGDIDASSGSVVFLRAGQPVMAKLNKDMTEGLSVFRPDGNISSIVAPIRAVEKYPRKLTSIFLDLSGFGSYKDTFLAYINAPKEAGLNPLQIVTTPVRGFRELKKKGDYFYEMTGEGGKLSGRFIGQDAQVAQKTAEMVSEYASKSKIPFSIRHPIQALEEISTDLSNATRMGMFMRLRDNGMTAAQAAVEARRVLADPFQSGASAQIKALSAASSFTNTGLQEIRNIARVASQDPGRVALKGLISVGIPSAISWSLAELNNDDQIREMRNAPGGQMFDFWRIGGKVIATPRPAWAMGQVFGTGMDTFLDATIKGEDSKKRWAEGFLNQIGVNVIPVSVQQMYTMKSGEQFMGPLSNSVGVVPGSQDGMAPEVQGVSKTSEAAKFLARTTGIDPFRWDAVMKGMLTSDGYKIEQLVERAAGNLDLTKSKPMDLEASDLPLISRYVRPYPTTNVASMRTFYDNYAKFSEVNRTLAGLEAQGKIPELQTYLSEHKSEATLAPAYLEIGKEIASMRKMIELVALQPDDAFPPEKKRQQIDKITNDMITLTRTFNQSMKGKVKK